MKQLIEFGTVTKRRAGELIMSGRCVVTQLQLSPMETLGDGLRCRTEPWDEHHG